MQTIWMREHNRVAKILSGLNPTGNDTIIFQEGRRIVIAEIQHITFNEFLPNILSKLNNIKIRSLTWLSFDQTFRSGNYKSVYGLAPLTTGFFTNYSSSLTSGPVLGELLGGSRWTGSGPRNRCNTKKRVQTTKLVFSVEGDLLRIDTGKPQNTLQPSEG